MLWYGFRLLRIAKNELIRAVYKALYAHCMNVGIAENHLTTINKLKAFYSCTKKLH